MKWLITNAYLVDPASGREGYGAVAIADGRIVAIQEHPADPPAAPAIPGFTPDRTWDAQRRVLAPALVDTYARLTGPVLEQQTRLERELHGAAAGGIGHLVVAPDTAPPLDEPGLVEMLLERARRAATADILPLGALTVGLKGEQLAEMARLTTAGCIAFSQGDRPMRDTLALLRAMQYAASFDLPVWLTAADPDLSLPGGAHDGVVAARLGLPPIPVAAETVALTRLIELAAEAGVRLHVVNLSSERSVALIRRAKDEGLPVSASVSALHLTMTELDIGAFDTNAHVIPPLRSSRDREALAAAVADGTIDVITSNHTTVGRDAKAYPFSESAPGAAGFETLLPLVLRWGESQGLSLAQTLAPVSSRAAALVDNDEWGRLAVGAPADLILFDPDEPWIVDAHSLVGPAHNTPWWGLPLTGRVTHLMRRGTFVFEREAAPVKN
ncbi:dihydroorotase [Hydrogenophilus thermoluteolus]|uniref:Dihydroorotase n=1 Tax=Hydrogenophilus thermoluteolus TaxID=297 RepID=A0A2Z6E0E5_HYDTE|nr:dihydroorotase [Hydrogenophilus thermoluteolus]MBW7656364.1 dihydroorotase [Hydrogenophilus thermoluteolus]BBD77985.1 dihydroorotase [Hydrogenophilus thermoluteolus]GLW60351.1 dihydroorotase [Hydrogenophilus thermoluteolus]HNQ48798.1 dihydroorotase [Hydrogenophilus thermoluteolus]HNU20152.1 dihydroorotase [Hydrogenophilus thermoluteolus]